jgi:hypothetical protein
MDLVNIQPEKYVPTIPDFTQCINSFRRIPPNLRFRVPRDHESIWGMGECSWDLIHIQMQCGAVSNWPDLYQKVFA